MLGIFAGRKGETVRGQFGLCTLEFFILDFEFAESGNLLCWRGVCRELGDEKLDEWGHIRACLGCLVRDISSLAVVEGLCCGIRGIQIDCRGCLAAGV